MLNPFKAKLSKEFLSEPISALSLAAFRIMFGFLLLISALKYHNSDYHLEKYYDRPLLFKYEYFEWVQLYPELWMLELHFLAMVIFAVLITAGFMYRISVIAFFFLFSYHFFLDQVEYLNHYYLVIIYLFLMMFLPMNARLSVDAWLSKKGARDIPQWTLWVLLIQTEIVLLYAGIVKINPDWLAGEPLGMWLRERAQWHMFGDLIYYDWFILAGAWGTVILHLIGGPLLLYAKTRIPVTIAYVFFHLMNSYTFEIDIFPYMAIGATLLFFRPDWPGYVFKKMITFFKWPLSVNSVERAVYRPKFQMAFFIILGTWLFFQVIIPMRPLLYPGNVAWTEEGHKFSWRMKLRDKKSETLIFTVKDPETGKTWTMNPFFEMDGRAVFQMGERVNMLLQYADYLENKWKIQYGDRDYIVTAQANVSLNGRKPVPIVDPDLDLTSVEWNMWPADWITKNNEPLVHWTERTWEKPQ